MSKQADLNPVRVELSNRPACKVSLGGMRSPYLTRTQAPTVQVQLRTAPVCKVSLGGMRSPYLARTQRG